MVSKVRVDNVDVEYEDVDAGVTAQVLGGSGRKGDYLSHLTIFPATDTPGAVALLDGAASKTIFPGGADSLNGSLAPVVIYMGVRSKTGAWKVTTGANVSVRAAGDFT